MLLCHWNVVTAVDRSCHRTAVVGVPLMGGRVEKLRPIEDNACPIEVAITGTKEKVTALRQGWNHRRLCWPQCVSSYHNFVPICKPRFVCYCFVLWAFLSRAYHKGHDKPNFYPCPVRFCLNFVHSIILSSYITSSLMGHSMPSGSVKIGTPCDFVKTACTCWLMCETFVIAAIRSCALRLRRY